MEVLMMWIIIAAIIGFFYLKGYLDDKNKKKFESWKKEWTHEYNQQLTQKLELLFSEKKQTYPWMAQQYADFVYIFDENTALQLEEKSHPAYSSAEKVRAIGAEKRELTKALKMTQYQLNYYETLFPWLEDFKESDPIEAAKYKYEPKSEAEALKSWLSPEEYEKLPSSEKYQLALDRFLSSRNKTNWQAGIDYERYIGYLFETDGYVVEYPGATKGLEDMGRDLIAHKEDTVAIIQCKRWAQEKTIHEKHIFQLYGSAVEYKLSHSYLPTACVFATTTELSDVAQKCADFLKMTIIKIPLEKYPVIKCHVTKDYDKIYHLPFDQQYDRIKNKQDGTLRYVYTVKEAESLGYRRAWKWHGTDN